MQAIRWMLIIWRAADISRMLPALVHIRFPFAFAPARPPADLQNIAIATPGQFFLCTEGRQTRRNRLGGEYD